jgi:hypothetical protein
MKRQDIGLPVLGYDTFEVGNFDPSLFDGYFELGVPENHAWAKELGLDSSYAADYIYDSVNIIMRTYERAGLKLGGVPTADEFREELYEVREYNGVAGRSVLEDSGQFRSKAFLKRVQNGRLVPVEEDLK